jgi:hypothetical protein
MDDTAIEMPWSVVHVLIYVRARFGVFTKLLDDDAAVPQCVGFPADKTWLMPKKYIPNYVRAIRMYNMVYGCPGEFLDVIDFLERAYYEQIIPGTDNSFGQIAE